MLVSLAERKYRDNRDITVDLQARLGLEDGPSSGLDEESFPCEEKNLTNPKICFSALCEGGNQSDCSINPLTEQIQGTDTPTPIMGCSLDSSSAEDYISVAIKEEPTSCEESNQSDCSIDPLTEQIQERDPPTPNMECSLDNSSADNYILNGIKVESVTWEEEEEEENHSECSDNSPTEEIKGMSTSASLMGCSFNSLMGRNSSKYTGKFGKKSSRAPNLSRESFQATYTCSECNKDFSTKGSLVRHQRAHTGAKPFSCSVCGKGFKRAAHLERHKKTHTGEKPFTCTQCGKCFTRHTQLTAHTRLHTGEKPFSCSECGKCFTLHCQLKAHCRIHTGEKPFSCPDCEKCFALASQLKVIHAGDMPFSCSDWVVGSVGND
uniref:C2H2-type domain-containing protein n=1 Tax=Xenopus tropicalis TaxID=8364 RepID=A0A6I8PN59_XENTR